MNVTPMYYLNNRSRCVFYTKGDECEDHLHETRSGKYNKKYYIQFINQILQGPFKQLSTTEMYQQFHGVDA